MKLVYESTIQCPNCGHLETETMPEDSCQFLYRCTQCDTVLRPLQGDCCVFCSYGTIQCPSKQLENQEENRG